MGIELPLKKRSENAFETIKIAKEFAQTCNKNDVKIICLKGNLGTGKTTFVKGFCEYFNITETVKSPTYTYYRLYKGSKKDIYHFDYYRLNQLDDIVEQELLEIIDKDNSILLIEWPEKVINLLPKGTLIADFVYGNEQNQRVISISQL